MLCLHYYWRGMRVLKTIVALFSLYNFFDASAEENSANYFKQDSKKDPGFFTLVVLPDTQGYADVRHKEAQKHWPNIGDQRSCFFKQTEWIKQNKDKRNIVMTVHVGDITQTDYDEEWMIADTASRLLIIMCPTYCVRGIMTWDTL